jgi:pyridoxine 5-phosphate synthase
MTKLSVNLNKVALLRNARSIGIPSVPKFASIAIAAGAHGITLHPRPDERHARRSDVLEIATLLRSTPSIEFNIEGNPFADFVDLVRTVRPTQCTLVPDNPSALTSDHGWDLTENSSRLKPIVKQLRTLGIRVSVFLEPDDHQIQLAKTIEADRIELYTEPLAAAYGTPNEHPVLRRFIEAAEFAHNIGLGVNAGHDLNLRNLKTFCSIPHIAEVSIGHALVSDALEFGLFETVRKYLEALNRN